MHLTHFGHACVLVQTDSARILFDPGTLSSGYEAVSGLDAVLITHQHPDHLDLATLPALLAANPDAKFIVDEGSAEAVRALDRDVGVVRPGDRVSIAGSQIRVLGGEHAVVHPDIPVVPNAAYLLDDGAFFHPGDSYFIPQAEVDVLGLPVSGPWLKLGEALDYVRAIAPRVAVPIHEAALASTATHYGMLSRFAGSSILFTPVDRGQPTSL